MELRHKVNINVTRQDGTKEAVLHGGTQSIRSRLLNRLLGGQVGVLLLTPGNSVKSVEIREIKEGDVCDE